MSDIESLFLAAYPLWPKVLLNKFSSLLSLEIAKFNPDINQEIINKYFGLAISYNFTQSASGAISVLNPYLNNSQRIDVAFYPQIYYHIDEYGNYSSTYQQACNYVIHFDKRLFSNITASISVNHVKTGSYSFATNPNYKPASRDMFGYSPATGGDPNIMIYFLSPIFNITVIPVLAGYDGARTVLAMIQNGVNIDVNQELLSDFVDFLNAYSKYGAQLAAGMSLQAEKNKQDLQQYKNTIADKLTARKNELSDLETQIAFAARNETNSAKRDMQNLALNAQSLILQLQDKIQ